MKQKRVLMVGAGAQAKYCCEIFSLLDGFFPQYVLGSDGSPHMDWPLAYGAKYEIGFSRVEALISSGLVDCAIPCMATPAEKMQLWDCLNDLGIEIISAIHPASNVATTADIAEGVIINAGAVVQPLAKISRGVMIHANVVVDHDSVVGEFANLAPGCSLAGWVDVGACATVYCGASVIPGIRLGQHSIVGAGSTVISDVPNYTTVVGVPAQPVGGGR